MFNIVYYLHQMLNTVYLCCFLSSFSLFELDGIPSGFSEIFQVSAYINIDV